jgi:membrane dipeptidase
VTGTLGPSPARRAHGDRTAGEVARDAGVSTAAVELVWSSEVVDLHLESFIPPRLWGYDLHRRHEIGFPFYGCLFGHVDFPRALEGGLTGAMWSIATNVVQPRSTRARHLAENARALARAIDAHPGMRVVRTHAEWLAARAEGLHAGLVCVQGGNAFEGAPLANPDGLVTRVTVVHLSNSVYGDTSSPARVGKDRGLTGRGEELVRWLDAERIFVDLAHAGPETFWTAVRAHDRSLPLIATHTGASAVHPMWRNLDDAQVKAIADTGGVVGVIAQRGFLGRGVRDGRVLIDHLEAFQRAGGEGCAAIGTDFDGFIVPPPDVRDAATTYYRLVEYMLERRWSEQRIAGVLGANFLRSFAALRP